MQQVSESISRGVARQRTDSKDEQTHYNKQVQAKPLIWSFLIHLQSKKTFTWNLFEWSHKWSVLNMPLKTAKPNLPLLSFSD